MALPTNRQPGDVISASDINDIATQVNTNTTAVAGKLSTSGGTMTGALNMGSKKITNLATPSNNADATTKQYVDGKVPTKVNANTPYTTWHNVTVTGVLDVFTNSTNYPMLCSGSILCNSDNGIDIEVLEKGNADNDFHTTLQGVGAGTSSYSIPFCIVLPAGKTLTILISTYYGVTLSGSLFGSAFPLNLA